jgi:hypothetical protein
MFLRLTAVVNPLAVGDTISISAPKHVKACTAPRAYLIERCVCDVVPLSDSAVIARRPPAQLCTWPRCPHTAAPRLRVTRKGSEFVPEIQLISPQMGRLQPLSLFGKCDTYPDDAIRYCDE